MKLKRVINFLGGPGTGKSTAALGVTNWLKVHGYNVEYVSEYAKELTYEDRMNILQQDQLYIFAKQHRKIYRLRESVEYVITDAPLILSAVYQEFQMNSIYSTNALTSIVLSTYGKYPNINFYLQRPKNIPYAEGQGRTQTEEQSKAIDDATLQLMSAHYIPYRLLYTGEYGIQELGEFIVNYQEK